MAFCDFDKHGLQTDDECVSPENDPQAMAVVYFLLLLWMFMGVALLADAFMGAIEVITSQSRVIEIQDEHGYMQQKTEYVWNATVANLSLMALGSSAPEILLSVIEIVGGRFFSGELGPSTIVGSAAFNLMIIIAVCVNAIPEKSEDEKGDEKGFRKIKEMGVFYVTASSSVLAYVWLIIILQWHTPDKVDYEEAILTFLFFFLLVFISWMLDKGMCRKQSERQLIPPMHLLSGVCVEEPLSSSHLPASSFENTRGEVAFKDLREVRFLLEDKYSISDGKDLEEQAQDLANLALWEKYKGIRRTRASRRVEANRMLMGGKSLAPKKPEGPKEVDEVEEEVGTVISFEAINYSVWENSGAVTLLVSCKPGRKASQEESWTVDFKTGHKDDTATADEDYKSQSSTLKFTSGSLTQPISITIIKDDIQEDDEVFTVELSNPKSSKIDSKVKLDKELSVAKVTIIDEENPGTVKFARKEEKGEPNYSVVYKTLETCETVAIRLVREDGSSGTVSVQYATENGQGKRAALAGRDFIGVKDRLEFKDGEIEKFIYVRIIDDKTFEKDEHFSINLSEPKGCKLGNLTHCHVIIVNDDDMGKLGHKIMNILGDSIYQHKLGTTSWKEQFDIAFEMPEKSSEPYSLGTAYSTIMHFLNFPWKFLAALIPPTSIMGGWACFWVSLAFVGVITAFIGDVAAMFGCCIGLKNAVTAITIVALGTSLPDTFASKSAAIGDSTADNSIGNVTGSNSVNVFLGLGLPWTIAAIYWEVSGTSDLWKAKVGEKYVRQYPNGGFIVPAGDLGFSVMIFSICAIITLGVIILRGRILKGELGGEYVKPTVILFILLWLTYVFLSSLKTYKII